MKIALIQTSLHWQNRNRNLENLSKKIAAIRNTDLIILPEMFTTGFTMQPEIHAESDGVTLSWMKKTAAGNKCCIIGSVSVKDGSRFYNRLYITFPDGKYLYYDKRHLFRMAGEDRHYTAGRKKLVFEYKGWKICPMICYDLRFPVWSRNVFDRKKKEWTYDLLIYVANWPKVRSHPWKQLLTARAIENQCIVAGVNRVGKDGNGTEHSGDSAVIDAKGISLAKTKAGRNGIIQLTLDKKALETFRKNFPAGMDADVFKIGD